MKQEPKKICAMSPSGTDIWANFTAPAQTLAGHKMVFRQCNADDLSFILTRLHEMDVSGVFSFWCNRNIIERAHADDQVEVMVIDGQIVGYVVGATGAIEILEILSPHRRKGYGRMFAEHRIAAAVAAGFKAMAILCSPQESFETFWQRLGFMPDNRYSSDKLNDGLHVWCPIAETMTPVEDGEITVSAKIYSHTTWERRFSITGCGVILFNLGKNFLSDMELCITHNGAAIFKDYLTISAKLDLSSELYYIDDAFIQKHIAA